MQAINVKCVIIYSIFISNIPTSVFKLKNKNIFNKEIVKI